MGDIRKKSSELESAGRRKAVKKIVGGVTVLAAYNMLPVRWEKPIIDQVFLPVHAQTSGEVVEESPPQTGPVLVASAGPISTTFGIAEDPNDEIYLEFDGSTANLHAGNSGPQSDTVFQFDGDYDLANWDWYVNGSNWPQTPENWSGPSPTPSGTGENNQLPGSYSFEANYGGTGGGRFRFEFTVAFTPTTPNADPRTMTVSDVNIYAI